MCKGWWKWNLINSATAVSECFLCQCHITAVYSYFTHTHTYTPGIPALHCEWEFSIPICEACGACGENWNRGDKHRGCFRYFIFGYFSTIVLLSWSIKEFLFFLFLRTNNYDLVLLNIFKKNQKFIFTNSVKSNEYFQNHFF